MKRKYVNKLIALLLPAVMMMSLAGCGEEAEQSGSETSKETPAVSSESSPAASSETEPEETGITFPLKEEMTFDIMVKENSDVDVEDWLERCVYWQELYEKTNVKINIITLPADDTTTVMNGMFAAGTEGDAIFSNFISSSDLNLMATSDLLLPLNDYITEENMPIFFERVLAESPNALGLSVYPDGNIYALPRYDAKLDNYLERQFYINEEWLAKTGMGEPKTIEELEEILIYFRDHDMNGNGDTKDEIPFMIHASNNYASVEAFMQMFGLATKDSKLDNYVYVEDGDVKFAPISQNFKDAITVLNRWYEEGLIWSECFTGTNETFSAKLRTADSAEPAIGAIIYNGMDVYEGYQMLTPPTVEGYDNKWYVHPGRYGVAGLFCMTRSCENPEILMAWADQFYLLEAKYDNGYSAVAKKDDNGNFIITPLTGDEGVAAREANPNMEYTLTHGNMISCINSADYEEGKVLDENGNKIDTSKRWKVYEEAGVLNDEIWPRPNFGEKDITRLNELRTDLFNTIKEKRAAWITGQNDIEAEWDAYVESLNKMGLEEFMTILQTAYDNYLNAME